MKYTFPTATYGQESVLVCIDKSLVPMISGALNKFLEEYVWVTRDDWQLGYNAIAEVQADMANNCLQTLHEDNEKLLALLNSVFNGVQHVRSGAGTAASPYVWTPPLPISPPAVPTNTNALRTHLIRILQIQENAWNGVAIAGNAAYPGSPAMPATLSWANRLLALQGTTGGFFGIGETPVTLARLLQADRVNTTAEQGAIPNVVEEILNTAQSGGSIASMVGNLLSTLAGATTDGGAAVLSIASAVVAATNAAATLAGLTATVEELRVLNRQLLGGSGQLGDEPPAAPADGLWREAMYASTQIPDAPETLAPRPLAQLLVNRDSFGDPLSAGDWLSSIAASSSRTAQSLWDPENSETALSTLRQIRDFSGQIRNLIGGEFALENVIALLTQLRERLGDFDHNYEQPSVLGRLDAVRNQTLVVAQRLFDATGNRTAAELLVEIIARLTTANTNNTATAAAAAEFHNAALALLNCICEATNGPPTGNFTAFDGEACGAGGFTERLTSPVLVFQEDPLGGADFAVVTEWTLAANPANVSWQTVADGEGGEVTVIYAGDPSGPRQLCVQVHAQEGEDVPILGLNFTPYRLNGSGQGGRPVLQSSGGNPYTAGFYSETSVGDDMGYYVTAAVISGEVPAGGLIIRIGAGPLG